MSITNRFGGKDAGDISGSRPAVFLLIARMRVPANHRLRKIQELVREVLKDLSRSLGKLYASEGRRSVASELLNALLLQVFDAIRSETAADGKWPKPSDGSSLEKRSTLHLRVSKGEKNRFVDAVMDEAGIDTSKHRPHTFEDLEDSYLDLIVTWQAVANCIEAGKMAVTAEIYGEMCHIPGKIGHCIIANEAAMVLEVGDSGWDWQTYVDHGVRMQGGLSRVHFGVI